MRLDLDEEWVDTHSFLNRRWYEYTGLSHQESLGGRLWMDALHPDDQQPTAERWLASVANGEPFEIQDRLRNANGTYRWFLGLGLPLRDETGRIVRWFGTCTDIDRKVVSPTDET